MTKNPGDQHAFSKTKTVPGEAMPAVAPSGFGWIFALAILTGAFLLFQVQPLICKFILPWFGGGPAVWTTCMLFFQTFLFAGYAYAHFTARVLNPRMQGILHIALIAAAILCLPILPSAAWRPTAAGDPVWRILILLCSCVGLPYLVLASTGPLVQSWYAQAFPGRSPYRLYALSNLGSLVALVSYPFIFEPNWTLKTQSTAWSLVFGVYATFCGACAVWVITHRPPARTVDTLESNGFNEGTPSWLRRLSWVALPAVASLMLLAATNHVCSDVAPMPFLWVVPLALYLLTFVIAFDHERWYLPKLFAILTLITILGPSLFSSFSLEIPGLESSLAGEIVLIFTSLFLVAMVCHGELVLRRPGSKHLTEFYLSISAGGALGGVFVSLVAPHIFTSYFEWPIALAVGLIIASWILIRRLNSKKLRLIGAGLAVVCSALVVSMNTEQDRPIARARNFYGVTEVFENRNPSEPEHSNTSLVVEGVNHGRQLLDPAKRQLPLAYYGPETGVGRAFAYLSKRDQPLRIGVVGMGIGTLATYAKPGDLLKFYEINPDVLRFAEKNFTYLKDCKGQLEIVMGDARLSLEREDSNQFDILVLDAFSGHSVPTHLLTRESVEIYLRHLKPDGILAFHVTNTFLELTPIVVRLADEFGLRAGMVETKLDRAQFKWRTVYVLVSREASLYQSVETDPLKSAESRAPLWTDGFNDLFSVLAQGRD